MSAHVSTKIRTYTFLLILSSYLSVIRGHGRLIEPPSRASAWRYGFSTPHNYNDHELYCGGFTRQWVRNGGKCGVCGDPWDTKLPRAHEFGGTYGEGVIVRKYGLGQVITLRVELTASHFGHFEFSVCPDFKNASQDCLSRHLLKIVRPQDDVEHLGTRYFPKDGNKVYEMRYRLPKMPCPHCLLQWRYIAGNNWGSCPNGTGAVGCGNQEEFRACADIAIGEGRPDSPDYNEIPEEHPVKPEAAQPQPGYSPIASLITALVSFLAICSILCLIFFHYYRIGSKLRRWIADNPISFAGEKNKGASDGKPPVAPPRGRRVRSSTDGMYEVNLKAESPA